MRQYIPTYWFLWIDYVGHPATGVCCHLVGDEDGNIELLTDFLQLRQHLPQHLLPLRQLAPPRKIHPKRRHYRIHNHQRKLLLYHGAGRLHE